MIELRSVTHQFGDNRPLLFPDWKIGTGDKWLLLGESGSGKTTLLHILTGLMPPLTGEVIIDDTSIYSLGTGKLDQFRGRNIGIIFQHPHLIRSLTIRENLKLTQSFAGLPEDALRIDEVLESLHISLKSKAYPDQLSQGQLQRVSVARAVLNKPSLLIADEPTSSLDDKNANAVLELLEQQSALNAATLLVATHDKRVKDAFKYTYHLI